MKTRITDIFNIEYPIFQGGMAWVAEHNLAAAVSEAGGLGIIGAGGAPAAFVREQIQKVKAATDKPFGVNVMLMNPEADEIAQIIVEEQVKVVTTGAGNPAKYMEQWKAAGVKVVPVVASVAMARMMERGGADAIIAEGMERPYRFSYNNDACAAGGRCSWYSCCCRRWYCRRQRICGSVYAGRRGRADWYAFCGSDGIHCT